MKNIKKRKINKEIYNKLIELNYSEFLANIYSGRLTDFKNLEKLILPKLKNLDNAFSLADIEKAVKRLIIALENKEVIGIETDHDCDGQTSNAIIYQSLTKVFNHPKEKLRCYIGHRLEEGYGLSLSLANRILADEIRPTLIITADNGSTDEPRIKLLLDNNIETIVTDHHAIPVDGIPKSAIAVINPTREDCDYPDKYIAGCMVSWLFMVCTRSYLNKNKNTLINLNSSYDMKLLLDFVAVGTIADCVNIADSVNNRAVVKYGLKQMNANNRVCWKGFLNENDDITSETIGFKIAPLLNSDGRLSDALSSVSFLLCDDDKISDNYLQYLETQNKARKLLQTEITNSAMIIANSKENQPKKTLIIFLKNGHSGVHGISASRIKDTFGKPTAIFCKQGDSNNITGSFRSIDEIDVKFILDEIHNIDKNMFVKYGGHKAAAGATIDENNLKSFAELFEQLVNKKYGNLSFEPKYIIDGDISNEIVSLNMIDDILKLAPFGRFFSYPIFSAKVTLTYFKLVGVDKNHLQIRYLLNGIKIKGIYFNIDEDDEIIKSLYIGCEINILSSFKKSYFKNIESIESYISLMY